MVIVKKNVTHILQLTRTAYDLNLISLLGYEIGLKLEVNVYV